MAKNASYFKLKKCQPTNVYINCAIFKEVQCLALSIDWYDTYQVCVGYLWQLILERQKTRIEP